MQGADHLGFTLPYRYEAPAQDRQFDGRSRADFDRLRFALRAIDLLRPADTTVVVYRSSRIHVEQGRDLRRGPDARWAFIGIPSDASPESIALALASLEGVEPAPFLLDLTIASALRE